MTSKLVENHDHPISRSKDITSLVRVVIEEVDAVRAKAESVSFEELVVEVASRTEHRIDSLTAVERWHRAPRQIDTLDPDSFLDALRVAGMIAAKESLELGLPVAARPTPPSF